MKKKITGMHLSSPEADFFKLCPKHLSDPRKGILMLFVGSKSIFSNIFTRFSFTNSKIFLFNRSKNLNTKVKITKKKKTIPKRFKKKHCIQK